MNNDNKHFGVHLMMDLYDCDPKTLDDKSLVKNVLDVLPEKLGMKKLMEPCVLFANPNAQKDPGGWSGFVIIQESHISIHTFIKRRFVTIDVYSCKEFDVKEAVNYFKETFNTMEAEVYEEKRGRKYPERDIE
jgi:S-adenosylmethionine decarboxylase